MVAVGRRTGLDELGWIGMAERNGIDDTTAPGREWMWRGRERSESERWLGGGNASSRGVTGLASRSGAGEKERRGGARRGGARRGAELSNFGRGARRGLFFQWMWVPRVPKQ